MYFSATKVMQRLSISYIVLPYARIFYSELIIPPNSDNSSDSNDKKNFKKNGYVELIDELEDFNILCYRGKNFREDSLCNDLDFLKAVDGFSP